MAGTFQPAGIVSTCDKIEGRAGLQAG